MKSPQVIIIEGADSSGKTTLVEQLRADRYHHDVRQYHSDMPKEWKRFEPEKIRTLQFDQFHRIISKTRAFVTRAPNNMKNVVIIDRFFLSEWVYGQIYRGLDYPIYQTIDLMRRLDGLRILNILCDVSDAVREQTYLNNTQLYDYDSRVAEKYRLLGPVFNYHVYDWTKDKYTDLMKWYNLNVEEHTKTKEKNSRRLDKIRKQLKQIGEE